MVIAIDPKGFEPYVCQSDRKLPAEQQTLFRLRTLNARDSGHVKQAAIAVFGGGKTNGTLELDVIRLGLAGWSNLSDADGNAIEFEVETQTVFGNRRSVVSDDCLDRLPSFVRAELMAYLLERELQGLTEEERGKH